MERTPERKSAQDADSLSGLEKLRTQRSAFPHSHRPGGHPQDLTNSRGGPNQMIKSGPDRVDKPRSAWTGSGRSVMASPRGARLFCLRFMVFIFPSALSSLIYP